jgi:microcystin-dependent protein
MRRQLAGLVPDMTWPPGRVPFGAPVQPAPMGDPIPVPEGRPRWRLTLHERQFQHRDWRDTLITEIIGARGVRLETAWNTPAKLTLTLDGHHPTTAHIRELIHDIYAWRWDEWAGVERCMFRGIVAQSEDQLTEQSHTVSFVCHDYLKMLERRLLTNSYECVNLDQDLIVSQLLDRSIDARSSSGVSFYPGSYLPLQITLVGPDAAPRSLSTVGRDRTYLAQSIVAELLGNLANVIGGFDYDVRPGALAGTPYDQLRIFYPYQGVVRTTPLVYGTTVSSMTRAANVANYANYWRTLGHQTEDDPENPVQLFSEVWNTEVDHGPIGTWMSGDNASDVSVQDTLDQKAAGNLATYGQLIPTYTIQLRPGMYVYGRADVGDVVPLIVQSGRLDVQTDIRILGVAFGLGPDGEENIEVQVGRPAPDLFTQLTRADADVDALARRPSGAGAAHEDVGSMKEWPGAAPPAGWDWCDGGPLSRNLYPEVFDVIGYTFGGDGADVFNKPDCRGRMTVAVGQGNGLTNRVRGQVGGSEAAVGTHLHTQDHGHGLALTSGEAGGGAAHAHGLAIGSGPTVGDHIHGVGINSGLEGLHIHFPGNLATGGEVAGGHTHPSVAAGGSYFGEQGAGPVTPSAGTGNPLFTGGTTNHTHNVNQGTTSGGTDHFHFVQGNTGGESAVHNHLVQGNTGEAPAGGIHTHLTQGNTGAPSIPTTGQSGMADALPPWIAIGKIIRILPPYSPGAPRRFR